MFRSEEVELLLQIASDASLGGRFLERLEAVSESLATVVPCTSFSAFIVDEKTGQGSPEHVIFKDHDVGDMLDYTANYKTIDPMGQKDLFQATGRPRILSEFIPARKFGKDAFTAEYLPRVGVRHLLGLSHRMPGGTVLGFSLHRAPELDDFSRREQEIMRLVSPYIAKAAFGALLHEKMSTLLGTKAAPVEATTSGAIVFNALGDVLHADAGAVGIARRIDEGTEKLAQIFVEDVRRLSEGGAGLTVQRTLPLRDGGWLRVRISAVGDAANNVLAVLEPIAPGTAEHFFAVAARARLTPREREVAQLAIQGLGNRHIGAKLNISAVTVGYNLTSIYRKTGVTNRNELVALFHGIAR